MWEPRGERLRLIDDVLDSARRGSPSVLSIEGDAGTGKSSHLSQVLRRAQGFRLLDASGDPATYRPRFGILEQLGVDIESSSKTAPVAAARALQRLLDADDRLPVLVAIDDLQWADAESIESLRWLFGRLHGDRFALVTATRPLAPHEHAGWQRLLVASPAVTRMRLEGIDETEARSIVDDMTSGQTPIDDTEVRRLWQHTNRNPLYLRALLARYATSDLVAMSELPAPAEAALDVRRRLEDIDDEAARLLEAVSVLGSGWSRRFDAAALAEVGDPSSAVDLLVSLDLLSVADPTPASDIRPIHALIRTAVYQSMPGARRLDLHRRAGALLTSPMVRLEHEVRATDRPDVGLAARLEAEAITSRASGDHRRAAQLLLWAAQTSAPGTEAERLFLDAMVEMVGARDVRAVRAQLARIASASDAPGRTVVEALLLMAEARIADARHLLDGLDGAAMRDAETATRDRLLVLGAWARHVTGAPLDEVVQLLDQVAGDPRADTAVRAHYLRVAGQVARRRRDIEYLRESITSIPEVPGETPESETDRLAWRGVMYAMCGITAPARRDLNEVMARVRGGRVNASTSGDHALYGLALWLDGDLDHAAIEIQNGVDVALGRPNPIVRAVRPIVSVLRGDSASADTLLTESEEAVLRMPSLDALAVHMQAAVIRHHAVGSSHERRDFLPRSRRVFGALVADPEPGAPTLWQIHMAMAHLWEGDTEVEPFLHAIENDVVVPGWSAWMRPWLTGLAAEVVGDLDRAAALLTDAVAKSNGELPLYRAHVHGDLARIANTLGDNTLGIRSTDRARELYGRIGATVYLASDPVASGESMSATPDVFAGLSEREREVASLIVAGYSYAQVASELYITRSTVSYHLGRVYAKTATATRHELSEVARGLRRRRPGG